MTETLIVELSIMFGIGMLGAGHCIGMCGGIVGALTLAGDQNKSALIVSYNLGRILSYGTIGFVVAMLGQVGVRYLGLAPVLRGLAGVLLIAMALYMTGWWRGLRHLENVGLVLWKRLRPLAQRHLPVQNPGSAVMVGMIWGWLPCGLVYTALAYSATSASPWYGAAQMVAFGLGTLPAVVLGGLAFNRIARVLQHKYARSGFAMLMLAFGVWTLMPVLLPRAHH